MAIASGLGELSRQRASSAGADRPMTVFKTSLLATALLAATAIAPAYAANNDTFDVTTGVP